MDKCNEAVIVLCKCGEVHKTYGIRAEKTCKDNWTFTWSFPIKEDAANREGYDKSAVKGSISFSDEYPGCPYCGGHNWTVCSCGHLSLGYHQRQLSFSVFCAQDHALALYTGQSSGL